MIITVYTFIEGDITSQKPPPLDSLYDRQNILKTYETSNFTSPQNPCERPRTSFTGNSDVTIQSNNRSK